ncbi:hypothetical protein AOXY_G3716 [Acipenser oxyrinchus oxyrinchus]|uniref:Uncharacterized protein n=1 Tax=Acipenser oxyrinchus oxyrinchus TaxID=40147 RepID=A0AAD8GFZ0_ACIOX|nr:hypothetical protein AOXY_G3716 [Acipenser oxyrinchus oxyrinchus]
MAKKRKKTSGDSIKTSPLTQNLVRRAYRYLTGTDNLPTWDTNEENARVEYRGSLIHQHRRRRKKKISAFKVLPVEVTVMSTEESGEEDNPF